MKLEFKLLYKIAFWISLIGLIALISDFGFVQTDTAQSVVDNFYFIVLAIGVAATVVRYFKNPTLFKRKVVIFDFLSILFTLWIVFMYVFVGIPFETDLLLENPIWIQLAVIFTFIREFSELKINFNRTVLNPA